MTAAWFVVRTICQREDAVADRIRTLGFPAWTPCLISNRGPERREVRRALFEGYAFAACGPFGFPAVAAIDGVVGFLRGITPAGNRYPLALPAADLEQLRQAEARGDFDLRRPDNPRLNPGDVVRITAGLWRGYLGRLLHQAERRAVVEGPWGRLTLDPQLLEVA